jgi:hypothetical protein
MNDKRGFVIKVAIKITIALKSKKSSNTPKRSL